MSIKPLEKAVVCFLLLIFTGVAPMSAAAEAVLFSKTFKSDATSSCRFIVDSEETANRNHWAPWNKQEVSILNKACKIAVAEQPKFPAYQTLYGIALLFSGNIANALKVLEQGLANKAPGAAGLLAAIHRTNLSGRSSPALAARYQKQTVLKGEDLLAIETRIGQALFAVPILSKIRNVAITMLESVAVRGAADAYSVLALAHSEGWLSSVSKRGMDYLDKGVAAGSVEALAMSGMIKLTGGPVQKDPAGGMTLLEKSAEKGSLSGMVALIIEYGRVDGGFANPDRAIYWICRVPRGRDDFIKKYSKQFGRQITCN